MLKNVALTVLWLCSVLFLSAQAPSIEPAPSWLYHIQPDSSRHPSEKEISDGFFYSLWDLQVNIPAATEYYRYTRDIVNEAGVQAASEVSVTYAPEYQRVKFHYINLLRNGKVVSRLRQKQINVIQEENEASNYLYNNRKRAYIVLEDVRPGDQVDYAFSVIGFNPVMQQHFSTNQYFTYTTPITNFFYTVLSDPARHLQMNLFNSAPQPSTSAYNEYKVHHWSQPTLTKWESITGAPDWYDHYPYASLTTFSNWQEVAKWGLKVFDNYDYPLSPDIRKKATEMAVAAKQDQDLYAEMAIRFVQDKIRYLGFETGIHSHKPHDPNKIFRQGYGDCKDKALLLVRLLQEQGISAYAALVNTTLHDKVENESPSPYMFDHAIVAIQRSSGYIFIDATRQHQRGSLLNIYIEPYGKALVLKPGSPGLETVDIQSPSSMNIKESISVKFNDAGKSTLRVETIYKGGIADNMRSYFKSTSRADMEKQYEKYYSGIYDSVRIEEEIRFTDDSLENIFTVFEEYSIPAIWTKGENGKDQMSLFAKSVYEKIPTLKQHRAGTPLALSYPTRLDYSLRADMPETWTFPIKPLHISNDSYEFSYEPKVNGNQILLAYSFQAKRDHIPVTELTAFKTDQAAMEKVVEFELYKYGNAQTTGGGNLPGQNIYWPAVILTMVVGVMAALGIYRYNQRQRPLAEWNEMPDVISGATGFLGFTLIAGACL